MSTPKSKSHDYTDSNCALINEDNTDFWLGYDVMNIVFLQDCVNKQHYLPGMDIYEHLDILIYSMSMLL